MDSRGTTGGIVVIWDNRVLELLELENGEHSISCHFKNYKNGFTWTFTGVYGLTMSRDMECFWNELGAIYGLWNGPCVLLVILRSS